MSIWEAIGGAVAGPIVKEIFRDEGPDPLRQAEANYANQKEFATHGIRWRVEDAKAAGLHPLYALGGAGAAFQNNPITVGGGSEFGSDMGQNISRAMLATSTQAQREQHVAQLGLLKAQTEKETAMAQYYASEAARNSRPGAAPMPDASVFKGDIHAFDPKDLVQVKPSEVISPRGNDVSMAAGPGNPFWGEFNFRRNAMKLALPWTNEGPGESLENVPWYMWPFVMAENSKRYGDKWLRDLILDTGESTNKWGDRPGYGDSDKSLFDRVWELMPWERERLLSEERGRLWNPPRRKSWQWHK